jgi:beta-mannosidase
MPKISIPLTGDWQFKEYPLSARRMRDLDGTDWLAAKVPSSIYTCLVQAGEIDENELIQNPENFSHISEKPWIFKKTFDSAQELLDCDQINLVFDGLDTITSIWLNEKLIGRTSNMFIPHAFDVTKLLKRAGNILLVKFESATEYAKKQMKRHTAFKDSDFPNPHRVYIRKAQYQFGWDFCPSLPGCGIFRELRLEGIEKAQVSSLQVKTVDCHESFADLKIAVNLSTIKKIPLTCSITLSCGDQMIQQEMSFNPKETSHSTLIRIEEPKLWWPAGIGKQNLYDLDIKLIAQGQVVDQIQKKIGIRTLKLHRTHDHHRRTFKFDINGRGIYIKGANWIPASIFPGSVTSEDYDQLIRIVADANINMLRVWGGGYYENEKFYELCDQLGIMVWQDFMFACAYYPDRKWFLDEVKAEAETIIRRLRNHPCIALWCGNNEIDWLHDMGQLGGGKKFYGKEIYHKILPPIVAHMDPGTDYIPTTPLPKKNKFKAEFMLTTHNWHVWSGHEPSRNYRYPSQPIPHFVTEFGFQSLPNSKTISRLCPAEKRNIGSYKIEKHNYQIDGNSRLYRYIGDLFGSAKTIEQFAYFSQVTQARAAKGHVEYLRAHNTKNHGVMFWQLNDCAPAITWSAIDHYKNPKALLYYAKRFFADRLIAVLPQTKNDLPLLPESIQSLGICAVNDSGEPLTAVMICSLMDMAGNLLDKVELPLAVAPETSGSPIKLPKALVSPENPEISCLHLALENDGKQIAENLFLYLPDKYIDWQRPKIEKSLTQLNENQWQLDITSDVITKDLQIEIDGAANLSNNYFDLLPKNQYHVVFEYPTDQPPTAEAIDLQAVNLPA